MSRKQDALNSSKLVTNMVRWWVLMINWRLDAEAGEIPRLGNATLNWKA